MAIDIRPNILHDFSTYTYKFTLYMVPLDEYKKTLEPTDTGINLTNIHTLRFSRKVVLLESGTTSSSINSVSVNSTAAQDFSDVTSITMQIIQPKGFSFFETIIKACTLCGIDSNAIRSSRMFLELTFMGINENGVIRKNIFTITYPVQINDINTSITNAGTVYDAVFTVFTPATSRDSFTLAPRQMILEDVKTTTDFFNKLERAMNEAYIQDTTSGQANVNRCRFIVDPQILGHEIKSLDEGSPISDYQLSYSENTGPTISIPSETPIPTLIEGMIANVKAVTDLLLNGRNTGKAVHIEPLVLQGEYERAISSYTSNITWYVRFKTEYKSLPQNMEYGAALDDIVQDGNLSKKYEYYFTGMNTEVLNVEMDFSNMFGTMMAAYDGLFSNYANTSGFAPAAIRSQDEVYEREKSETRKSSDKSHAKPAFRDNSGSEVYYVDNFEHVDEDTVKQIAPHYVKRNANTDAQTSVTTQSLDSDRDNYMIELNNIRNASNVALLPKAALEIRGDPYWLSPRNVYIKPSDSQSNPRSFNLVYLKVGFPMDETNKIHVDEFMSTLYQVNGVVSEFNNGKFTQKIQCSRITGLPRAAIERRTSK